MPGALPSESPSGSKAEELDPLLVLLAAPRGFCAGVRRAIATVRDALALHGPPIYVRRAIVHNLEVVRSLEADGAVFVEELCEVPDGAVVIFSAHGVARTVEREANLRGHRAIDATCPLVAKVHREVVRLHDAGRHVLLVGHKEHPEIVGTLGRLPAGVVTVVRSAAEVEELTLDRDKPIGYAVQTTYAASQADAVISALAQGFSDVAGPPTSDICYATTNRQAAIRSIAHQSDAIIVAGESFSSNASRLAEVARASGCKSVQLVSDAAHVDWSMLSGARTLGITAAASTPETTVDGIIRALGDRFRVTVEEVELLQETTVFKPVAV